MTKRYSELIELDSFEERFEYLKLNGRVGELTFNGHRYLNQRLYRCAEWNRIRRKVIIRDNGCDLAFEGYEIHGNIIVHHINPITIDDIIEMRPCVFDLENLICTSLNTHNAVHYGDEELLPKGLITRQPNDTCLWR
jgi:predicted HNH restriction endonuclease